MTQLAFQDQMPDNHCWGCGACNEAGFQLKSTWSVEDSELAVATWRPSADHMAGPEHVLNGGVIATLLDCHTICTAVADRYREEKRAISEGETIWYVTAKLDLTYHHPTPIDLDLQLEAKVLSRDGKKTHLTGSLVSGGKKRASCSVLAVRVAPSWLQDSH